LFVLEILKKNWKAVGQTVTFIVLERANLTFISFS